MRYFLQDTSHSKGLPVILEDVIRFVQIDHENRNYKIEHSSFCRGNLFLSLSPIKERHTLDIRMSDVNCEKLHTFLDFFQLIQGNNFTFSGNLKGHMHLNIGQDALYLYSGLIRCTNFKFVEKKSNVEGSAKKLRAYLTTHNARNVLHKDPLAIFQCFFKSCKSKNQNSRG